MSKTPKCFNCGHDIDFENDFCTECGEEIRVIHCKKCNHISQENIKFCPKCGNKDLEKVKPKKISQEEYWHEYMDVFKKLL